MTEPPLQGRLEEFTGDPRGEEGFNPALFPLSNGEPFADGAPDSSRGRNQLRFLSVYYHLNEAYSRLGQLTESDSSLRQRALQRTRDLTLARDRLEDTFAPYGFIGEPELEDGIARNIVFTEPPQRFAKPKAGSWSSFSLVLNVADPREPEGAAGE